MKNDINQINFTKDDLYYKIMLIGGSYVGKTQILKRFCREEFEEKYFPTFGMDFRVQKYFFENLTITVQIIEVAGKNIPPEELLKAYILDADCFICVYDVSKKDSVSELNNIISNYERLIGNDNKKSQCWYFVGNKNDVINRECSNNIANIFDHTPLGTIGFIEVSAKENKFIENMFNNAIFQIKNAKRSINNKQYNNISISPAMTIKKEINQIPTKQETTRKCSIY